MNLKQLAKTYKPYRLPRWAIRRLAARCGRDHRPIPQVLEDFICGIAKSSGVSGWAIIGLCNDPGMVVLPTGRPALIIQPLLPLPEVHRHAARVAVELACRYHVTARGFSPGTSLIIWYQHPDDEEWSIRQQLRAVRDSERRGYCDRVPVHQLA
jgi:hypothetical protein